MLMTDTANTEPAKHTVVEGVAYQTVGDAITNLYVVLGGKRIYVFGKAAGDELTADEAKKAAKPPKAAAAADTDAKD